MSPLTLLVALLASVLAVLAVAIPSNATVEALEKRVTHSGRATYFEAGLGACGKTNKGSDMIVAISHLRWSNGGNCDQVRVSLIIAFCAHPLLTVDAGHR